MRFMTIVSTFAPMRKKHRMFFLFAHFKAAKACSTLSGQIDALSGS